MNTTIIKEKSKAEQAFTAVLTVGREYAQRVEEAQVAGDIVAEALAVSFGIVSMQDAIAANSEASVVIARHAGHKWGFRTDQDEDGKGSRYDKSVIIACFCEAALQKLKAVGNEFNIISSGLYVTKWGWQGKLSRLPGVTEIDIRSGAITQYDEKEYTTKIRTTRDGREYGGEVKTKLVAYVSATASCKVWGKLIEVEAWLQANGQDERYQVTGTAEIVEQMIDQLRGKAEARISERLFLKCVNLSIQGFQEQAEPQAMKRIVIDAPKVREFPEASTDQQPPLLSNAERFTQQWREELKGIGTEAGAVAKEMFAAWQESDADRVATILIEDVPAVSQTDNRIFQKLSRFANAISEYISDESV